jgi:hypothetical protein
VPALQGEHAASDCAANTANVARHSPLHWDGNGKTGTASVWLTTVRSALCERATKSHAPYRHWVRCPQVFDLQAGHGRPSLQH